MNPTHLFSRSLFFVPLFLLSEATADQTTPIDQTLGATEGGSTTINSTAIDITDGEFAIRVQGIGASGGSSSSENAGSGASMNSIAEFSNEGDLTVTQTAPAENSIFGILLKVAGGNGGNATEDKAKYNAGHGGSVGDIGSDSAVNNSAITLSSGTYNSSFSLWEAALEGGNGGAVTPSGTNGDGVSEFKDGGTGGAGGSTGSIQLNNSGNLTAGTASAPALVLGNAYGIFAKAHAGAAGEGSLGINGANGGAVSVTNSGQIELHLGGASGFGAYGINAQSVGSAGTASYTSENHGGNGGTASDVTVTLLQGGDVLLDGSLGSASPTEGVGIHASSVAGSGGQSYDRTDGGNGGTSGTVAVDVTDAMVTTVGDNLLGISAYSDGGNGGNGGVQQDYSNGGNGGNSGASGSTVGSVTLTAATASSTTGVSTSGDAAGAISVSSRGGNGGQGTDYDNPFLGVGGSGNGGNGGAANNVAVTLNSTASTINILTQGDSSVGIHAQSIGGNGNRGGDISGDSSTSSEGGSGGSGGNGGAVTVNTGADEGALIQTQGTESDGIILISQGGTAGRGGDIDSDTSNAGEDGGAGGSGGAVSFTLGSKSQVTTTGDQSFGVGIQSVGENGERGGNINELLGNAAGNGGNGGNGGALTIGLDSGSTILTEGKESHGLVARNLSGAGGAGGNADDDGVAGVGGDAGSAGNTQGITANFAGSVATAGDSSFGVLLQSLTGSGGNAGDDRSVFYGAGGNGGSAGTVGEIQVSAVAGAEIATQGDGAHGLVVQSIAGGGGSAGDGNGAVGLGGDSSSGGNGGEIVIHDTGSISTLGQNSIAVLTQSIAGGGGTGGSSNGVITIGSDGAAGGYGGTTSLHFTNEGDLISTAGQLSHGLVNQSIGGGGGNGGNASSTGPEISVAIGGSGGAGGNGGAATVTVDSDLEIVTGGSNSIGIVNQSIAGGGGTGGSAYSYSAGFGFDAAVGVGGSGGSGGNGGSATVGLAMNSISTGALTGQSSDASSSNPVDAYGVVVQSIGGGGGVGGSATAEALAIAVPIPETETSFAVSTSASVGGSGGIGGTGGAALFYMNDGSTLVTQGQGSHGVIVQSIGGGGGLGGDSSASAATLAIPDDGENSVEVSGNFTMGGSGGGAGSGGTATAYLGGNASGTAEGGATSITTFGDYSNALLVQSIGGGGGNAGFGSGNTNNRGGTESIDMGVDIGATGGSGGEGGTVTVEVLDEGTINTYGSGSHGIVAQSIGGGGGTSQGGSLSFGGAASLSGGGDDEGGEEVSGDDDDLELEGSVSIALGKDGGAGSNGGAVTVSNAGTISTRGGDSAGILAQSIGGGGGLGGGAGSDASADNPVDPTTGSRLSSIGDNDGDSDDDTTTLSADLSLEIGGGGGSAADGGVVSVTNDGSIYTTGDWSSGIIAQSIGGGGGKGGTALAANTDGTPDLSINLAAGGNGGEAGNGGAVALTLNESNLIATAGYGAFGIHAQSIGGGGGIGVDGSLTGTGKIQLGGDLSGTGGSGGSGGTVTLTGDSTVITAGGAAHAVVLQSIGGGGGTGGQGSSLALAVGSLDPSISLSVGGGSGSTGNGGTVTITDNVANISTTGWASYGILAQSIGGGGGLAWGPQVGQDVHTNPINIGGTGSSGNGDDVDLTLNAGSQILTTGLAAHAIVAQSIGGGGGIAGYPSSHGTVHYLGIGSSGASPYGNGFNVNVDVNGTIQTSGDAAHGIFAQSIGGGGGFRGYETSVDMGSISASGSGSSVAGSMTITQAGVIHTSGENSIGILAQQASPAESTAAVDVTINGDVTGGSGSQGYGAWIITDTTSASTLTINSTGSLGSASGVAARFDANGSGDITTNNNGTLTGSIQNGAAATSSAAIQVNNLSAGRFFAGSQIEANVNNAGELFVGHGSADRDLGQTVIAGDFVQSESGTLIVRTDFEQLENDSLQIEGDAELNGSVRPELVPGASVVVNQVLTVLTVDGAITNELVLDETFGGIFDYDLGRSANSYTLAVTDIDMQGAELGLSGNQRGMATYLEDVFRTGSDGLGIFASLDAIARSEPDQLGTYFDELTPGATLGFAARGATETQYFSDAVLNGPIFEGSTATLAEMPSAWMRVHGRTTSQHFSDSFSNYDIDSMMYQVGGQVEVASNTYLGGSIAYRHDSLKSDNHLSSGNGDTVLAAVTLKHEAGPWQFAGALSGSLGWFDTSRHITLPGDAAKADGSPRVQTGALALRAAYTQTYDKVYIRPMVTATGVYTNSSSYKESGAGALNLDVDSANDSTVFVTPAFEIGARTDFANGNVMRSFVRPGVDFASSDSWKQDARLSGAPESVDSFTTKLPMDRTSGTVVAGIDLQFNESSSLHFRYDGKFSDKASSNGVSIGFKHSF